MGKYIKTFNEHRKESDYNHFFLVVFEQHENSLEFFKFLDKYHKRYNTIYPYIDNTDKELKSISVIILQKQHENSIKDYVIREAEYKFNIKYIETLHVHEEVFYSFVRGDKHPGKATSLSQLNESNRDKYREIEFICVNTDLDSPTTKENQINLFRDLIKYKEENDYNILPYIQDFSDEKHEQRSLSVIILDKENEEKITKDLITLGTKNNIDLDLYLETDDDYVNGILRQDRYDNIILSLD